MSLQSIHCNKEFWNPEDEYTRKGSPKMKWQTHFYTPFNIVLLLKGSIYYFSYWAISRTVFRNFMTEFQNQYNFFFLNFIWNQRWRNIQFILLKQPLTEESELYSMKILIFKLSYFQQNITFLIVLWDFNNTVRFPSISALHENSIHRDRRKDASLHFRIFLLFTNI